jgi:hypothetical protein
LIGEEENLCTGIAQSGIRISTWRDLTLDESLTDLPPGKGKAERLARSLETIVEVREELNPMLVQGLSGATTGS